jgi:hypothetical protein
MKKLFYSLPLVLLFPPIVLAAATYSRSSIGTSASSPIVIDLASGAYDKDITCGGLQFWGIQAVEHVTGKIIAGEPRFVHSGMLPQTFTLDVPPGDYEEVTFTCSDDGENLAFQSGSLENDVSGDQIIFTATSEVRPDFSLFGFRLP